MHKAIDKWQVQRTEMAFVCLLLAAVVESCVCGMVLGRRVESEM